MSRSEPRSWAAALCLAAACGHLVAFQQESAARPAVALGFLGAAVAASGAAWAVRRAPAAAAVVLGLLSGAFAVAGWAGALPVVVLVVQLVALWLVLREVPGAVRARVCNVALAIGVVLWALLLAVPSG